MSLLERLRFETTEFHERLHTHPALTMLVDENLLRPYVTHALKKFYGFYAPLERRYALTSIALKTDFPAGAIINRLQNDLRKAGIHDQDLPTITEPETPLSSEETVAYLYLREGSNLGGKVISKNLERSLKLEPGIDNQFFWGHGADTGKNWQLFLEKIKELEPLLDLSKTAAYAATLFQKLDAWLHEKDNQDA